MNPEPETRKPQPETRIVIVGLGVGGLYASKSAMGFNRNCRVTVIEKRSFDQFSACGLPFVLAGVIKKFEELKYEVPAVSKKFTKLLMHEAIAIDPVKKCVTVIDLATSEERAIPYDSLILATGASPICLPVPGAEDLIGKGVHFCSNIENSSALLAAAQSSKLRRAVVVGGGAIGLEVALGLGKMGLDVAVTKQTPHPFPRNLDPAMGKIIVEHLESHGIRVLFGKGIDRVNGKDSVESVEIAGERIVCDIVVMAGGMRPNTKLAEQIGAKIDKGFVVVNNRMETSVNGIYAVGDLVRTHSRIDGTPATMQLATAAYQQGIVAGINAAGGNVTYPGVLNTFLTVIEGLEVASTGYTLESATSLGHAAEAISTIRETRPHYMPNPSQVNLRVICESNTGKILGAQAIGAEGAGWRINLFSMAIQAGMTLHDIMETELAYNPPFSQMYDPIAQAAEVGLKRLGLPPRQSKSK